MLLFWLQNRVCCHSGLLRGRVMRTSCLLCSVFKHAMLLLRSKVGRWGPLPWAKSRFASLSSKLHFVCLSERFDLFRLRFSGLNKIDLFVHDIGTLHYGIPTHGRWLLLQLELCFKIALSKVGSFWLFHIVCNVKGRWGLCPISLCKRIGTDGGVEVARRLHRMISFVLNYLYRKQLDIYFFTWTEAQVDLFIAFHLH